MNILTVITRLLDPVDLTLLKKAAGNVGWPRWFQIQLGKVLIEYAIKMEKKMLGSAAERAEHGLAPHWMSRGRSRRRNDESDASVRLSRSFSSFHPVVPSVPTIKANDRLV